MRLQRAAFDVEAGWEPLDPSLDGEHTLALLFGASRMDVGRALAELRARLPSATVLGCSTAGEIHHDRVRDDSISAAVLAFDHTRVRASRASVAAGGCATKESREAGLAIAHELAGPELRAVLVFCDGLIVNGSALAAGLVSALGPDVIVTGGLAADGDRFEATWVIDGARVTPGLVVAVGLYGRRVQVGHGSKGGWDIFGPERRITRSEGNVLYELDGKPALALYKHYLGERASGLPATALLFPLAVRAPEDLERRVVRTVLAVDEATQSLRFAGDVPEGSLAQLMKANFDRLVMGASDAAAAASPKGSEGPVLSIAITCIGRRLVLKGRIEEEVEATLDALPPGTQQIGFYSYGELSPSQDGPCDLHNQTMTLTTISER